MSKIGLFLIGRWFILFLVFVISCEKNPTAVEGEKIMREVYRGAIIVNEGHFQQGDASLSYFDSDSQKIFSDVFKQANGEDLGDVANSIYIRDSLAYLVINNSDKIEVVNTTSFKRHQKINLPAGTSPRYLTFSGAHEILVTSLYSGKVLIIDLLANIVTGEIPVGNNPEEVLTVNEKVFVANSGFGVGHTVSVIGLPGKELHADIGVGDNPRFLRPDESGRIHVLCSGGYNDWADPADDTPGGIWVIDPLTEMIVDSLVLPAGKHPGKFEIGANKTGYIVVDNRVVTYDTHSLKVIEESLISSVPITPYALRYSIHENMLYILDAVDYINPGKLWIYDPAGGALSGPFYTGAIPGDLAFIFKEESE